MSSGITRKPLGRPRAKTPAAGAASLLEQRRVADRARQSARIARAAQAGGRLIGPVLLNATQAAALDLIQKRDGRGISDAVRRALAAYAAGHRKAGKL